MGRQPDEPDYGLPDLTVEEAARTLGVQPGAFLIWLMGATRPSQGRWSEWTSGARPLPERVIRLYLSAHAGAGITLPAKESPSVVPRGTGERRVAPAPRSGRGAAR